MQALKYISSLLIVVLLLTGCHSTIALNDVEALITNTIDYIMTNAIQGTPYKQLNDIPNDNNFKKWYEHTLEQWHIPDSKNEDFVFEAFIDSIQIEKQNNNSMSVDFTFDYIYKRTMLSVEGENFEYTIGENELGKSSATVNSNEFSLSINRLEDIEFYIK